MWRHWSWGLFRSHNENRYKVSEIRDYFQKYKDTAIPEFIYKRARSALEHCIYRTHYQTDFSKVKNLGLGMYQVQSFSNPREHYDVTLGTRSASCDCPDFPKKKRPCKHIMTIFMMLPKGSWADVSDEVRLNPVAIIGCEDEGEEEEEEDDYDHYGCGFNYYRPRYTEGNIRYTQAEMKAPGFFKIFPEFLKKRQSAFIKHCMWRTRYRYEIGDIQKLQDGSFKVQSLTNLSEYYQVKLGPVNASPPDPTCNCPDWEKKGWPCKHILAILMYFEEKSDEDKTKKTSVKPTSDEDKTKKTTMKPTSAAPSEKDKGSKATKAVGRPKKEAVKRAAKGKAKDDAPADKKIKQELRRSPRQATHSIGAVKTEIKTEIKSEIKTEIKSEIKSDIKTEIKTEEPNYPVKTEIKKEIKTEPNWADYPVKTEIKQELKTEPNCSYYPLKREIKKEVE